MSVSLLIATIQPMDWSATAAWIALAISIIGTITGPLITIWLTNRHKLKLRNLDIQQEAQQLYANRRFDAITTFLQKTGSCVSRFHRQDIVDCVASFHCIYQYVPDDFWPDLDKLYTSITDEDRRAANVLYPPIARRLSEILKETPQVTP